MHTTTGNGDWAVEADGLVKVFGANRAVDGVDLRVRDRHRLRRPRPERRRQDHHDLACSRRC